MKYVLPILLLLSCSAVAQVAPPPDPAFLQRAISVMQSQRNQAMDGQVVAEAKAVGLAEDLAKAQVKIKELEAKLNAEQKP